MSTKEVKNLYKKLNTSAETLRKSLNISYLEALAETAENILDHKQTRVIQNQPDEETVKVLDKLYHTIDYEKLSSETVRRSFQLALIQANKVDYIQANHQITPDNLGLLISYLIQITDRQVNLPLSFLDLGTGSGNLLFTIYNQLVDRDKRLVYAEGIEIDDLLLSLAASSKALQGLEHVTLTLQDALTNLFVDPVDIVVSDLPIGYYPDDTQAKTFKTSAKEGKSFAHFLFIEQAMRYLKEGGFGFFIVPSKLFATDDAMVLLNYIQSVGYFQGLVQLPESFVANSEYQQSILMIQKQGAESKQAKEVLISTAPDFKQESQFQKFLNDVLLWKQNNIN